MENHPAPALDAILQDLEAERKEEADALVDAAKMQPLTDGGQRTSELLTQALSIDPDHHEARILLERLHQMFVPRWHFPMLTDRVRNRAYARAITAKVKPGDIVLDIGTGAGLTAMLAAQAGAKHVYTCEQQPLIAQAAERVIAANGLADRITVVPKMSHNLVVGKDLPEPADVIVSEIVDTLLLGEGALATLAHAMDSLAKPGARIVPESGTLFAQLVESKALFDLWRPDRAEGFCLQAFHPFAQSAQITPNDFATLNMRAAGPAVDLFGFDFRDPAMQPAKTTVTLPATWAETIHAVFAFFSMELAPGIQLGNDLTSKGHWGRTAYLLDKPISTQEGGSLPITAQHDTSHLSLRPHDRLIARADRTRTAAEKRKAM